MTNEPSYTRVALVTGASKGIGAAIAERVAVAGYATMLTYKSDEAGGHAVVDRIRLRGAAAELFHLDVREENCVQSVMRQIDSRFGHLDVIVNNAGMDIPKNIEDATLQDWETVIATKVTGAWLVTKYGLPLLKKARDGNVIMITTVEGERPNPDYLAYGVANAAAIALVKALSSYLPKYGIRVNGVSPGEVRTPMWKGMGYEDDKLWKELAESNPMGRVATVDDVARGVMVFLDDPGKFLNGNILYVNGGKHLKP